MKTIKGLLGYVGFGVSAIISQGRRSLGPGIWRGPEKGAGGRLGFGVWAITQFFRLVLHEVNKPGELIKPNTED